MLIKRKLFFFHSRKSGKTREEIQEELEENERFFAQLQTYVLSDPIVSSQTSLKVSGKEEKSVSS